MTVLRQMLQPDGPVYREDACPAFQKLEEHGQMEGLVRFRMVFQARNSVKSFSLYGSRNTERSITG